MSRIEQIAELIVNKLQPQIPVANQLWDSADIANYLRRSQQVVVDRVVCKPDFPKAIRLEPNSRPLWEAKEVMAWALAHKEHAKGRRRAA